MLSYGACRGVMGFYLPALCMTLYEFVVIESCICCVDCNNILLYLNSFQLKSFGVDKTAMFYA